MNLFESNSQNSVNNRSPREDSFRTGALSFLSIGTATSLIIGNVLCSLCYN
jgi:hypothetical protein